MDARLNVGTSGWHYQHWRGTFYPSDLASAKMFGWYARHFSTVELNNSFYRLPTEQAVVGWRSRAPAGFTFAVKASRFITHMKKLKDPETAVQTFFDRMLLLKEKLGPVLFQLPPGWSANPSRLQDFLEAIPRSYHYVFEFRDESWHTPGIYRILSLYNAALCIHDWRTIHGPAQLTADFTYVRMHGPSGSYQGSYDIGTLETWARRIESWSSALSAIYIYFNNDVGGHAVYNAQTLLEFVRRRAVA